MLKHTAHRPKSTQTATQRVLHKKPVKKTTRRRFSPTTSQQSRSLTTTPTHALPDSLKFRQDAPFDFQTHESRWNKYWDIGRSAKYSNPDNYSPTILPKDVTAVERKERPAFYSLSMFPYPSGDLHMGHVRVYTISDCLSRYYTQKGFNVIHPMGWDAFGLPAENAARDRGVSPATWTYSNIKHMRKQMDKLGFDFQWDREVATCSPDYYKWTQWIFVQLFKMGLAYRKKATVNWDPIDETVLANEQVDAEGKSWRSGAVVERRDLHQWFFKITQYSEDLLKGIDTLGDKWPGTVKLMQQQWIGRKNSAHINFALSPLKLHQQDQYIDIVSGIDNIDQVVDELPQPDPVSDSKVENYELLVKSLQQSIYTAFTTRPDTIMGVTYVAILPEHPALTHYLTTLKKRIQNGEDIFTAVGGKKVTTQWIDDCFDFAQHYTNRKTAFSANTRVVTAKHRGAAQAKSGAEENTTITSGFETPLHFIHPITNEPLPLFMADYVDKDRGTGVVMGVPGHDHNDFAFAKQHNLKVKAVIQPNKDKNSKANKLLAEVVDENGIVTDLTKYVPHVTQLGSMVNSAEFNTQDAQDAAENVIQTLTTTRKGYSKPSYQLHDWLVSRQRYWGTPIPIIYCNDGCGPQPVPEADLPIQLPEGLPLDVKGRSPLASTHPVAEEWRKCSCPSCGSSNATRETDTLDTFIDSSWYFLRYLSSETHRHNERLTDHITPQGDRVNKKAKKWQQRNGIALDSEQYKQTILDAETRQQPQLPWNMAEMGSLYPVTQYIGGIEHAILHLLYSRFISYALFDAGLVQSKEPFNSLLTQGMVHGESFKHPATGRYIKRDDVIVENNKGVVTAFMKCVDEKTQELTKGDELTVVWEKMSKSKGNGVNPNDMVEKYGADVCRMFVLFKAPPEKVLDWEEQAVQGMSRWVNRLNILVQAYTDGMKAVTQSNTVQPHPITDNFDESPAFLGKLTKQDAQEQVEQQIGRKLTTDEESIMSLTTITVNDVTRAMENRQFNVAIARLMSLSNELFDYLKSGGETTESSVEWSFSTAKLVQSPVYYNCITTLLRLLTPIAPHFSSESFSAIQHAHYQVDYDPSGAVTQHPALARATDIRTIPWPSFHPTWSQQQATTMIQLNGKLLFSFDVDRDIFEKPESEVLSSLCANPDFKALLAPRLPADRVPAFQNSIDKINDQFLNSNFKRVITKSSPKFDKVLVNFVL